MPTSKSSNQGRGRSAVTGRYVPKSYAKSHPKTTVIEKPRRKK
ncbi:MAG: hypothetical protein AAB462_02620 [Patescibacteria group bacterium]